MNRSSTAPLASINQSPKRLAAAMAVSASALLATASITKANLVATSGPLITLAPVTSLGFGGESGLNNNVVTPGDTFSVAIVGFNGTTSTAAGAYLTTPSVFDPVFGTTNTYPGDALGSQTLTITSGETFNLSAGTTTDTITLSVPTNFAPTGTKIGTRYVDDIELDIGAYNAIPADTLDYTVAPGPGQTGSGSINYSGGSVFALNPLETGSNGGLSYQFVEGVTSGSGASQASSIETLNVNLITVSITYPTVSAAVPEPASLGVLGVITLGLLGRTRRPLAVAEPPRIN